MTEFSIKRLGETLRKQHGESKREAEHRSHTRYRTFARVKFRGHLGEENLLKDISVTGCCVECTSLVDIQLDIPYILEIIPESAAKIGQFDIEVKAVWIREMGYSGEVGFTITASPKGKLFQRYVDYLSWREDHSAQRPADSPERSL
ncbi:MAG: PilZ domain-containing protein [Treponema sp.]|jgi:hypothetical protein|nr:PilZ domain-containing protein [Treponema sp.]